MRLILVRHGETEWNQQKRIQGGGSDTDLSATGREQAQKVARSLEGEKIEAIYSSPLKRALNTAAAIARYHNIKVQTDNDLREIDVGELEGITLDNLVTDFSSYLLKFREGEGTGKLPGGESLQDLRNRVWSLVQGIVKQHSEIVVIVSHYFVTLSIICAALDMPVTGIKKIRVKPGSTSILDFNNGSAKLAVFNDTCHLR